MLTPVRVSSVSGVIVLACLVGVTHGQQRRGLSLPGVLSAATVPAVAKQLELTGEQTTLAQNLHAEIRHLRQDLFAGLGDLSQEERQDRFAKYTEQRRKKENQLGESVGAAKLKRLRQLSSQAGGLVSAFFNRETAQQLEISDDQRREGLESLSGLREEFTSAGDDIEARNKLLKKASEKLSVFLTDDQKNKWEKMLGKPASEELLAQIRSAARRN